MEKVIFKGQILASKDSKEVYFLDELDKISWSINYVDKAKAFAGKKVEIIIREVEENPNV